MLVICRFDSYRVYWPLGRGAYSPRSGFVDDPYPPLPGPQMKDTDSITLKLYARASIQFIEAASYNLRDPQGKKVREQLNNIQSILRELTERAEQADEYEL